MKKWPWLTALVVVIIIGGFALAYWASRPVSTESSSTIQKDRTDVLGATNSVATFNSPYFSTQIPENMLLKTSNENSKGPIYANYLFTNVKTSLSDQIAITVGAMGLNSLTETSGVKQRLNEPETYQKVTIENAPQGAVSFKKTEGYETAVFWKQGAKYFAVVVSGPPQRVAELDQMLQTVLTNWSSS